MVWRQLELTILLRRAKLPAVPSGLCGQDSPLSVGPSPGVWAAHLCFVGRQHECRDRDSAGSRCRPGPVNSQVKRFLSEMKTFVSRIVRAVIPGFSLQHLGYRRFQIMLFIVSFM